MVNDLDQVFAQGVVDGIEKTAAKRKPKSMLKGLGKKISGAAGSAKKSAGKVGKWVMKNKGKSALIGAGAAAAGYGGYKLYKHMKNKNKE
jgi:uncharacterized protein YcfJ